MPEETPINFAKFLRTPFLQNNSGRLLLKVDIAITKQEIDIIFVLESRMQCLLLSLKSQRPREESHHPAFMGICPTISTRISLIYLIDELFFWFLMYLKETRRLGDYKVLSFCFLF